MIYLWKALNRRLLIPEMDHNFEFIGKVGFVSSQEIILDKTATGRQFDNNGVKTFNGNIDIDSAKVIPGGFFSCLFQGNANPDISFINGNPAMPIKKIKGSIDINQQGIYDFFLYEHSGELRVNIVETEAYVGGGGSSGNQGPVTPGQATITSETNQGPVTPGAATITDE